MDGENPYAPPRASLDLPRMPASFALASRWLRLFAAMIDALVMISLQVLVFARWFGANADGSSLTFEYIFGKDPLSGAARAAGWILVNVWLLAQGQTIGKRMLSIRAVRTDGRRVSLTRMIFVRLIPMTLVGFIPIVGPWIVLASLLPIFGRSRRCVHDYLADTIVIRA